MAAFRKELLLQIGPIQTTVNLHSVAPRSKTSARLVCPDHTVPLKQQYRCPEEDHVVAWGTWDRAVETAEGWRKVKASDRPTLEAASKVLELTPVPAKEIEENTFTGESIYWMEPSNEAAMETWSILVRQMNTGKVAFVTRGGFKKGGLEKLWRLELFRGYPVLRELVFPDKINKQPEGEPIRVPKDTSTLVGQFIEARMSSWDEIDTVDRFQTALNEWVSKGELVKMKEASSDEPPKQTHEDMMAALKEAVEKAVNA